MLDYPIWKRILVLVVCLWGLVMTVSAFVPDQYRLGKASYVPTAPINLGLDLRGGAHLLLELDTNFIVAEHLQSLESQLRADLRTQRVRAHSFAISRPQASDAAGEDSAAAAQLRFMLTNADDADKARKVLRAIDSNLDISETDGPAGSNGLGFVIRFDGARIQTLLDQALDQSIEVVRRRVDEFGTTEPLIQRQGINRILVQVPGISDTASLKALLNTTARLTFHLVREARPYTPQTVQRKQAGLLILPGDRKDATGNPVEILVMDQSPVVGGESLENAQSAFQDGRAVVNFTFDAAGGRRFGQATAANIGQRLAIILDDEVISAPTIQSAILGGNGMISGDFTVKTAGDLALLLRAGALPAPLTYVEERTVGPGLGQDSIEAGEIAAALALLFVIIFMIASYGRFGAYASIALIMNLCLIMAAVIAFKISLTLPGIAGLVLTIGMAVDANVLIYERIREEARSGRKPAAAIEQGYKRAIATILDSNLTTLIGAILLFAFGAGPIKGFALTLSIGILSSMFCAIMVTRFFVVTWLYRHKPKTINL